MLLSMVIVPREGGKEVLNIGEAMKTLPISVLKDIENESDLVVGQKYNGFSEKLIICGGRARLFNRSGSEQTDNVPHITGIKVPESMDLILVGEGHAPSGRVEDAKSIFGSGPAHSLAWQEKNGKALFTAVNITRWKGEDLSHIPFGERLRTIYQAITAIRQLGAKNIEPEILIHHNKYEFFNSVVSRNGEGVVVKKLSGFEKDWFKVKKVKTWDAVIVGFTTGKGKYSEVIGAIRYGFYDYDGNLKETGKCSGMTDIERYMFVSDSQCFIGRVVEIKGQELGNRGGIIFPRFVRIRDDKLPTDCLLPCNINLK